MRRAEGEQGWAGLVEEHEEVEHLFKARGDGLAVDSAEAFDVVLENVEVLCGGVALCDEGVRGHLPSGPAPA
eukprot:CAMPEP_0170138550 /NCGR_PEP_ID=MMETSP0033_2-20121228/5005_1 /TAXON_ID=195969 /ORGANISM="Dolichomastix tenuilepis, Strain CCMP3274" /LENGTH=71 /DNA_ID=CAMNT_0010374573 /DNA_START=66 /DNA_END=278 /DNA_ORIENTATION=+